MTPADPSPTQVADKAALQQQRAEEKIRNKKLLRAQLRTEALLRIQSVDLEMLDYPHKLLAQRFGVYSQNEEDGIILALLKDVAVGPRAFVDIGCGRSGGNSGFMARELGFSGLMVDAHPAVAGSAARYGSDRVKVEQAFVTAESFPAMLEDHGLAGELDVLSIDIDGNDFWIWNAATVCTPRIVVMEYNATWGAERALTIPYTPEFDRSAQPKELGGCYFGASLQAAIALGEARGYRLVCVDPEGINAFFVRSDLAPHIPALEAGAAFVDSERNRRLAGRGFDFFAALEEAGVPCVDLEQDGVPAPGQTIPAS